MAKSKVESSGPPLITAAYGPIERGSSIHHVRYGAGDVLETGRGGISAHFGKKFGVHFVYIDEFDRGNAWPVYGDRDKNAHARAIARMLRKGGLRAIDKEGSSTNFAPYAPRRITREQLTKSELSTVRQTEKRLRAQKGLIEGNPSSLVALERSSPDLADSSTGESVDASGILTYFEYCGTKVQLEKLVERYVGCCHRKKAKLGDCFYRILRQNGDMAFDVELRGDCMALKIYQDDGSEDTFVRRFGKTGWHRPVVSWNWGEGATSEVSLSKGFVLVSKMASQDEIAKAQQKPVPKGINKNTALDVSIRSIPKDASCSRCGRLQGGSCPQGGFSVCSEFVEAKKRPDYWPEMRGGTATWSSVAQGGTEAATGRDRSSSPKRKRKKRRGRKKASGTA